MIATHVTERCSMGGHCYFSFCIWGLCPQIYALFGSELQDAA